MFRSSFTDSSSDNREVGWGLQEVSRRLLMHQIQDLATITTTNDLEGLKGSDVSAHTVYTAKESVQTALKNYLLPLDEDKLQTLIIKMRHGFRFGVRLNTMSQTFQLVFNGGDPHTPRKLREVRRSSTLPANRSLFPEIQDCLTHRPQPASTSLHRPMERAGTSAREETAEAEAVR